MKKIVFIGDSITAGFKKLNEFENIKNLAVGGYKTTELIPLVKETRLEHPDILFLLVGINDILCNHRFWPHGYTIPYFKTFDCLLNLLRINMPKAKIYVISVLPVFEGITPKELVKPINDDINALNKYLYLLSKSYNIEFLDMQISFIDKDNMYLDGIHLNDDGYKVYFDFVSKYF